jgi:hypothetical protein
VVFAVFEYVFGTWKQVITSLGFGDGDGTSSDKITGKV